MTKYTDSDEFSNEPKIAESSIYLQSKPELELVLEARTSKVKKFLLLKPKDTFIMADLLVIQPVTNMIKNLKDFALNLDSKNGKIDEVREVYDGLILSRGSPEYYSRRARLEVNSYYQNSKGGRAKFIEKRFSSFREDILIDFKISSLPQILKHFELYRKQKLKIENLTKKEKALLKSADVKLKQPKADDITVDICQIDNEVIKLVELKNGVGSGGVPARQEFYTEFRNILDKIIDDKKIFEDNNSINHFLKKNGLKRIILSPGFLFSSNGLPATLESDKEEGGFFSESRKRIEELLNYLKTKPQVKIIKKSVDLDRLEFNCVIHELKIEIMCKYGNDLIELLVGDEGKNTSDLITSSYLDLALAQEMVKTEREILLRENGNNSFTLLRKEFESNEKLNLLMLDFANNASEVKLKQLLDKIIKVPKLKNQVCDFRNSCFLKMSIDDREYIERLIIVYTIFQNI